MSRRTLKGSSRAVADHPPTRIWTCMGHLHVSDHLLGRGPHVRIDGAAAYNGYLWPLPADDFWANQQLHRRHSSRWHLRVIALLGGGWLADGCVYRLTDTGVAPAIVYPTREAALRVAGARLMRTIRHARAWRTTPDWCRPTPILSSSPGCSASSAGRPRRSTCRLRRRPHPSRRQLGPTFPCSARARDGR